MSVTPPNISPRLRSRQPIMAADSAPQPVRLETPGLRVLIRVPNVASVSTASPRLVFASRLFSTLKRKYAAGAFAVFVVCMVAMLLRGKREAAPHDETGAEAPHWNSAVTVAPSKSKPSAPITQSAASQPHGDDVPMPWSVQQCSSSPMSSRFGSADRVVLPVPDRPKSNDERPVCLSAVAEQCIERIPRLGPK